MSEKELQDVLAEVVRVLHSMIADLEMFREPYMRPKTIPKSIA